ncbi:multidrug-resistance type transporter [Lecanora helva]
MTSVAALPPTLDHLESQPDNLLASSDIANESYVSPQVLSEVLDQPKAQVPTQPSKIEMNGTTEHTEVPPLQPESQPVKNNKGVPWYHTKLTEIDPITRGLLENYSKVPPEQVLEHVFAIREKAWDVYPYPCIGQFLFLNLTINLSPYYPDLVARLRDSDQTLLDLGCCFAQDVRKLVSDGARSENIYGADLYGEFMELGYHLFKDRKSLKSTFFPTDIMNERDLLLNGLSGQMDVVYMGLFLHHFDFETCVQVCVRVSKLLKPKPGSLVMGCQVGSLVGDTKPIPIPSGGILWRHDIKSFEKVWEQVGEQTGTKWRVEARLEKGKGFGEKWQLEGTRRLGFEVWRE